MKKAAACAPKQLSHLIVMWMPLIFPLKTSAVWCGADMNGLMFTEGMQLIGAYILGTQFSIRLV